jgi:uncharacterized protein YjbI with pentapeptide repeats
MAMADEEHLRILKQGVKVWNRWRKDNPVFLLPDLRGADLRDVDLAEVNLSLARLDGVDFDRADLSRANLYSAYLGDARLNEARLSGADLSEALLAWVELTKADLSGANLGVANLTGAVLRRANLNGANLSFVNLHTTNLDGANLNLANLTGAVLIWSYLSGTDLDGTTVGSTVFAGLDLREPKRLDTVLHDGPSFIDTNTIYRSHGQIPEKFLRGCGVPDNFITYIGSLTGKAFEYYSCFISYSHKDEAFAQRLRADLQDKGVRCWFAREDIAGGRKIYDQIDPEIRFHDKTLLVLSEHSIGSPWVMTEIRRTRKAELRDKRQKLFPIRLVDMDVLKEWECFDADTGKDLAVEVREYHIPDFSNWENHAAYRPAFDRLLRDLKAEEG